MPDTIVKALAAFTDGQVQDFHAMLRVLEEHDISITAFKRHAVARQRVMVADRVRQARFAERAPRHCGQVMRLYGDESGSQWECVKCSHGEFVAKMPRAILAELTAEQ